MTSIRRERDALSFSAASRRRRPDLPLSPSAQKAADLPGQMTGRLNQDRLFSYRNRDIQHNVVEEIDAYPQPTPPDIPPAQESEEEQNGAGVKAIRSFTA